jgi:hypothetical protein
MEEKLEHVQRLLSLFDDRETHKTAHNREIAAALNDGLLTALFELLGLPTEDVVWEDFFVLDSVIVVAVQITYDTAKERTEFLRLIAPVKADKDVTRVTRSVKFGIPLLNAFEPLDQIKQHLINLARETTAATEEPPELVGPPKPPPSTKFDAEPLSDDQLIALMAMRRISKATKQ